MQLRDGFRDYLKREFGFQEKTIDEACGFALDYCEKQGHIDQSTLEMKTYGFLLEVSKKAAFEPFSKAEKRQLKNKKCADPKCRKRAKRSFYWDPGMGDTIYLCVKHHTKHLKLVKDQIVQNPGMAKRIVQQLSKEEKV